MKYYLEEHGRTRVTAVAGISTETLVSAAKKAEHDETPATLHFDATHAIVHWRDSGSDNEYKDAKTKWEAETKRGMGLINLRVSSGGQHELEKEAHKKWERKHDKAIAYVLNARNQVLLSNTEFAEAFFKMNVVDAENVFSEKLDQVNEKLRRLFERPGFVEILVALAILCKGYLMFCTDQSKEVKAARDMMGIELSECNKYTRKQNIIKKSTFLKIFGEINGKKLIEIAMKEWNYLKGDGDFNAVQKLIKAAMSIKLEVKPSMVANAYIALSKQMRSANGC